MGRRVGLWAVATAGALVASAAGIVPAQAAGAVAAPAKCGPAVQVLAPLPGHPAGGSVNDLAPHGVAVGSDDGLPVWWTGSEAHPVPLPEGYGSGTVNAVNKHGLMVGTLGTWADSAAFSYRIGDAAVHLLPGGRAATDVNNHGHIVGTGTNSRGYATGLEWAGGVLRRQLPLAPALIDDVEHSAVDTIDGINDSGRIIGSASGVEPVWENWTQAALTWPAALHGKPTVMGEEGDSEDTSQPSDIDNGGNVVGTWTAWHSMSVGPMQISPPYDTTLGGALPGDRENGYFNAISPTTGLIAGTGIDWEYGDHMPPRASLATVWSGVVPALVLPRLARHQSSGAAAASDDDRVGGAAGNASGVAVPVVWNCALQRGHVQAPPATPAHRPAPGIPALEH